MIRRPVLACFFALVVSSSAPLLAAPTTQIEFFEHVASGDVQRVMRVLDPALQAEVDAPVLAAWIAAFNERLGPVTSIKLTGSSRPSANGIMVGTSCDVTCQRGTAKSELTLLKGNVVGFNVISKQMANFFKGPASTDLYEELGKKFIREFLSEKPEVAHALCHTALQKVVSLEQLKEMIVLVKPHVGQPARIEMTKSQMQITDDAYKLVLDFQVAGNEGAATCEITIEFVGLKGHLLGFDFDLQ